VQIDTPEVHNDPECYGKRASGTLWRLTPVGTAVLLYLDRALDRTDRFGRLLRDLVRRKLNVSLKLVQIGAAAPHFYDGDRGRYASQLLEAAARPGGHPWDSGGCAPARPGSGSRARHRAWAVSARRVEHGPPPRTQWHRPNVSTVPH
jgi:hypothetical protein